MKKYLYLISLLVLSFSCKNKTNSEQQNQIVTGSEQQATVESPIDTIEFNLDKLRFIDSEKALKKIYGTLNVQRDTGYYPEGMGQFLKTVLYPNTNNEVSFIWKDDTLHFQGLSYLEISKQQSLWKTKEGIGIGSKLKDLEKLNGKSFKFYGFGWDYAGTIDWDNGTIGKRNIMARFEEPDNLTEKQMNALLGDHTIESSSEMAQELNPAIYTLIISNETH